MLLIVLLAACGKKDASDIKGSDAQTSGGGMRINKRLDRVDGLNKSDGTGKPTGDVSESDEVAESGEVAESVIRDTNVSGE